VAEILDHPAVFRVRAALELGGVHSEIVILDEHARTAAAAAGQLGVSVAQIANSLVFSLPRKIREDGESRPEDGESQPVDEESQPEDGDSQPEALLVLTSGAHRVDTVKVADLLGVARLDRADAAFVKDRSGFAIGGVAPVGHPKPLRTLVDVSLAQHDEIWAAAGHPRSVFRTTYDQLLRLTGGTPVEVI
jgi:prolyl-tRNA editing enzyme YbaK/EbsC (Cys-tRNA(Pro) deacylase)